MMKKLLELSQQGKLIKPRDKNTYKINSEMLDEIQNLISLPDDKINLCDPDAPEIINWDNAIRGKFYRPIKKYN